MYSFNLNCTLTYLTSEVKGYVLISGFASLVGIHTNIMSSKVGLKIFAISSGIKKYNNWIIKKKRKKYD